MKRFIIAAAGLIVFIIAANYLIYQTSFFIDFNPAAMVTTFTTTDSEKIYLDSGKGYQEFFIRGVNMGVGIPGHYATEYAIDVETYLRWFQSIKEMGANTIRVYTILQDDFYEAFYQFNHDNPDPLYLIHGVWVDDYVQNSHMDAYDDDFLQVLLDRSTTLVDVLHGRRKIAANQGYGGGSYTRDVSSWVIGYLLGLEWEDVTVAYTDHMQADKNTYSGEYMVTTEDASPFEAMLAHVGDHIISYESKRYKEQRLVAFSNWPTTDPFTYPDNIMKYFKKCAWVDVEHIKTTDAFLAGTFASYHVYSYYPDYLNYTENSETLYRDASGEVNTYLAYLKTLTEHHTIPVVISEFGVPTARGMAQLDKNRGFNQGGISETEQGEIILREYADIKAAGCAGCSIFTWQDEWFKRTWNTMHAVDLLATPYWSDYQTNEQYFGLLSFDPGKETSVCYIDGDITEWSETDQVLQKDGFALSMKYDEKFLYFLIYKKDFDVSQDQLYLPIDTTPKSGSDYCENYDVKMNRPADFMLCIDGMENSRVLVQERYEVLRAMYLNVTEKLDPYEFVPAKNTPVFKKINLLLQTATILESNGSSAVAETYETGLLTYGNANPESTDFNSLADFIIKGDYIELKLPWQLLNFSNPSEMQIHDDYYENYGVENIGIREMYVGLGDEQNKGQIIELNPFVLTPWKHQVTYHERLKASYYIIQKIWTAEDPNRLP